MKCGTAESPTDTTCRFANDKQAFFDAFSDAYVKLTLKGVVPTSA
jgi:catalase (peroxidase I)